MQTNNKIIEINGVKLEVDLRTATRVEEIRVGTRVKVLKKEYSSYKVFHGIVIGFEPFKELPTIIVAIAKVEYSDPKIEFLYYNSESKEVEIVVALDEDKAAIDKNNFLLQIDREIGRKEAEILELNQRKNYFLEKFASYWTPVEKGELEA